MLKKHIFKWLGQFYNDSYGHYKTHFDYYQKKKKKLNTKIEEINKNCKIIYDFAIIT
jgi:hypothetical protein